MSISSSIHVLGDLVKMLTLDSQFKRKETQNRSAQTQTLLYLQSSCYTDVECAVLNQPIIKLVS